MTSLDATTTTDEQCRALRVLAHAVSGESLDVVGEKRGEPAWCDRQRVFVDLSLSQEQLRQTVCAQALLVAAGGLDASAVKRLIGQPAATRSYMHAELRRAVSAFGERLPHRIEAWLHTALVGEQLPLHLGVIRPARLSWSKSRSRGQAAVAKAPAIQQAALDQHSEDDELIDNDSRWLQWLSSPLSVGSMSSMFMSLLGFGRSPAQSDEGNADSGGAVALGDASLVTAAPDASSQAVAALPEQRTTLMPVITRWRYPEWNVRSERMRDDWVHVHEVTPRKEPGAAREDARVSRRLLRRQLASVGVELARHRAQPEGDDLDLDRLVRFATERQDPSSAERLYLQSRRTRRDLALLVLLDVSQSTSDRSERGTTIFGQQREVAREIVTACHRLGDRVALYGFHSWGRHQVRFERVKTFDETLNRRVHDRLDALKPEGLTRMGAALRHGTHWLARDEQSKHRVMLLLSDGFAYDDEYGHRYAEADTRNALEAAAVQGIACVCLNIGSAQDDAVLQRLYGRTSYLRTADATKAVPALRRLIRSAMLGAEHTRRHRA